MDHIRVWFRLVSYDGLNIVCPCSSTFCPIIWIISNDGWMMMDVTWYHIPLSASNLWTKMGELECRVLPTFWRHFGHKISPSLHGKKEDQSRKYPPGNGYISRDPGNEFWQKSPPLGGENPSISFRLKFFFFCHQKADTEPQKVPSL